MGLIMVYSSTSSLLVSQGKPPTGMVVTQLQFWLLSLVAMFFIYKMKTTVFQVKGFIMFAIVVISVLLLAVRFTKLGAEINGAKGWIQIGTFSMQPAEYLKIMVIWYLAYILGRRQKYIDKEFKKAVFRPMLLVGFLIFLVAIQPDLGNAAILTLLVIIMVLASGINYMYTYLVGGAGILGSIAVIQTLLLTGGSFIPDRYQYVYQRFAIFLNPFKDERNAGHQLANSYYAINNGGWFGKGLGNSIQKKGFLPEAHSDFIFAITIEELGLLAALMILAILMFMIARIILVGVRSKKPFNSLMCIGIGSMLLLQVFINLGGITGVIPLTGVTFPFLSQGGNSVLIISIAVAFVLNISADEKKQKMDQEYQLLGS
ncbi:cell division protein FtsW [Enterococcus silesiacus]|uniref:Probable peptidoglycan glycosyltransferase FtsW n=1 Tax=Enterococcus silesiacus TaxID=332949 RepID=A0AA91GA24_9ENTE|nr:cell division protein FtsW [Enterococcus silesiacus]